MVALGVNIDHVATLRQARGTIYPDPLEAAFVAERFGADAITAHLREDRRHMQERDIRLLRQCLRTRLNLEMAVSEDILGLAEELQPSDCCLVPERRAELTTEGGLDVCQGRERIGLACARLAAVGVRVSLFVDPERRQLEAAEEPESAHSSWMPTAPSAAPTAASRRRSWQRYRSICGCILASIATVWTPAPRKLPVRMPSS